MNLGLTVTLGAGAILLVSMLWAMMFKKHALMRLVFVAARAVLAFIATITLKRELSKYVDVPALLKSLAGSDIPMSDEIINVMTEFAAAFASVLVFFILYMALWVVMLIPRWLAIFFSGKKGEKPSNLKCAVYGLIQGLIFITVLLVPVSTYAGVANKLIDVSDTSKEIKAPVSEINDSFVVKSHRTLGGNILSDSLTSMSFKAGKTTLKTNLNDEIDAIASLVGDITPLSKTEPAKYTDKEFKVIEKLGSSVTKSKLICALVYDVLNEAVAAWDDGKTFMEMPKPSLDPTVDPIINKSLSIMAKDASNVKYLKEDINTLSSVIVKIFRNTNGGDMQSALLADGLVRELLTTINENERMRPLIPAITNIGLSIVGDSLGIDANAAASYKKLNTAIANELKASAALTPDERQTNMEKAIDSAFSGFGITDISDTEISIIAMSAISHFDGSAKPIAEVTADDVAVFIADMVATAGTAESGTVPTSASGDYGMANVSSTASKGALAGNLIADICAVQGNSALNAVQKQEKITELINNFNIYTESELSAEKKNSIKLALIASAERGEDASGKALAGVCGLIPKDDNTAFKYTVKSILISDEVLNSKISKESADLMIESVSAIFSNIANISESAGKEGSDSTKLLLQSLGMMLDSFSQNEQLYGREKSDLLMQTILHSGNLTESGAISPAEVETMLQARKDKNVSYTVMLTTVYETSNTLSSIGNGTQVTKENIGSLVDTLTNENSGSVVAEMISPERLADMGFEDESASPFLKSVITNISVENEAEKEKEVAAISNIVNLMTESKKTEGTETDAFGEGGRLGCTADDFINSLLDSSSVSAALSENELSENPFGITLTEDDKQDARDAISAKEGTVDDTKLTALSALLGLN